MMKQKEKQFQRTEDGHLLLMSNEERNLLITDLTARLNYGVICLIERFDDFGPVHRNEKLTGFSSDDRGGFYFEVGGGLAISFAEKIMPYLRSMPSMTEEEKNEFVQICPSIVDVNTIYGFDCNDFEQFSMVEDFLLSHHFDYRGLIPMGLAMEAPPDMYKTE